MAEDKHTLETLVIPGSKGNADYSVRPSFIHLLSGVCERIYHHTLQNHPTIHVDYGELHSKTFANKGMVAGSFANDKHIILAFRGTKLRIKDPSGQNGEHKVAWYDIGRALKLRSWDRSVKAPLGGKISNVIMNTLASKPDGSDHDFYEVMRDELNELRTYYPEAQVSITGHSLGGMLASAFAAKYMEEFPDRSIHGLYTFAQPRTGTVKFNKALEKKLKGPYLRVAIDKDSYTQSVSSTVNEKLPSPLRWKNKEEESNDKKRVHGGTALIYYTDEKRFNNEAPNQSYGYAERHDRPQIRVLIPESLLKDEKGKPLELTALRRHQILTHRRAAGHIKLQLTKDEVNVYPRQKKPEEVTPKYLPRPDNIDTAQLLGPVEMATSLETGCRV